MKPGYLLFAACLLLLTQSCHTDIIPDNAETPDGLPQAAGVTYTATAVCDMLNAPSGIPTKTTLDGNDTDGYRVLWSSGDQFRLMYKYSRMYSYWGYLTYTIASSPGNTSANFATTDNFKSEDYSRPVMAFYPANLVPDDITGMSTTIIGPLQWPIRQSYVPGRAAGCPMVSASTDPSGPFTFLNLGGVLRLTVKGSVKVTSIRISAAEKLSGQCYINAEDEPLHLSMKEDELAKNSIVLDCPEEGVQLTGTGVDFHFNLPPGEYTSFQVDFYDGNLHLGSCTAKKTIVIERSRITPSTMTLPDLKPGRLLAIESQTHIPQSQIVSAVSGMLPAEYAGMELAISLLIRSNMELVKVRYATTDVDGRMVAASGLIAYPTYSESGTSRPISRIVSVQHGTCDIDQAPTVQELPMELLPVAVGTHHSNTLIDILVDGVYGIACMADYLGYGDTRNTQLLHPYLHNRLTGSTCADLILATQEFIDQRGICIEENGETVPAGSARVDLVGYSQGGAATLSTMLELLDRDETQWAGRIGGVWAGAGPYDIPAFMDFFVENESYIRSCYIPFAFRGLAYGEGLSPDWDNIYGSNVGGSGKNGSQLEDSLFSQTQVSTWTDVIGTNVKDILHPDFYKPDYNYNSDILSLLEAAENNSVVNQTAPSEAMKAKIKLYHSPGDNTVPYRCSQNLQNKWGLGSIIDLEHEDHVEAAVDFLLDYCGLGDLDKLLPEM